MEEEFKTVLERLMSILGEGASLLEARQLLLSAKGNLQHALNLYCDRTASAGEPKQNMSHLFTIDWICNALSGLVTWS